MDTIGSLELSWNKGYSGSPAEYISPDVICYKSGSCVKFIAEDGTESFYSSSGDGGIGSLAVHGINGVFAFSEKTVQPKILVLQFPSMLTVAELKDGAQLEYISLSFSTSDYLASISGMPEYQLIIWKYTDGTKLISQDLVHEMPTCVAFNPGNWRQLAISTRKKLTIWTVEQNHELYRIGKRSYTLLKNLLNEGPAAAVTDKTSEVPENKVPENKSPNTPKMYTDMPISAIAGLQGADAEKFREYQLEKERLVPVTHCWTPTGDIYVGCLGGQLLKIDSETNHISLLTCHQLKDAPDFREEEEEEEQGGEHSGSSQPKEHQTEPHSRHGSAKASRNESRAARHSAGSKKKQQESYCTELCGPLTKPPGGLFTCFALHKRALFTGGMDGTLCELEINGNHALLVSMCPIGAPITCLNFNPSHHKLAIGSTKGSIHLFCPDDDTNEGQLSASLLFDVNFGNFLAVRSLATANEHCVTLRDSGQLQVWTIDRGHMVASVSIGDKASALGTSPLVNLAAVGTNTGHLHFIDIRVGKPARVIHVVRLHEHTIREITFNANGEFVLTASSDGTVFVLDGKPSKNFQVLGFVAASGAVISLSTHLNAQDGSTHVLVTYCKMDKSQETNCAASKLVYFCLPSDLASNVSSKHNSLRCEFKNEVINKMVLGFTDPVYSTTLVSDHKFYAISQRDNTIQMYQIPDQAPKLELNKDFEISPMNTYPGHQLPGGKLELSPHSKWLASCGGDGRVCVRLLVSLNHIVGSVVAHSFWKGGVFDFGFTPDSQCILTTGYDGTLSCFRWSFSAGHLDEGQEAISAGQSLASRLAPGRMSEEQTMGAMSTWVDETVEQQPQPVKQQQQQQQPTTEEETEEPEDDLTRIEREIEAAIARDEIYMSEIPKPKNTATWLEIKQYEAMIDEDRVYAATKLELREEIREMRRKLQKMMSDNEELAQIEKLPRHEFDLDIEEQKRLQAQCEVEVQKLRDEKEFENLAKMYLTDIIRHECWDDMMVKGRGIVAFGTQLEVYNFPLKERPRSEVEELNILKARRRIEIAELDARKHIVDRVLEQQIGQPIDDDKEILDPESSYNMLREKSTLNGNQADEVGADTALNYSQFDLCTREQKINEIKFIEDSIYRIKLLYNKDFDDVLVKKELEIAKIKDKNKRIRKILDDLGINDPVYQPELGPIEKPEMLLVTDDSEVKIEKFLTPEQQRKLEEEQRLEEERRLREKRDNWRERGLDQMMGGVLEIKKEDELKKDIPIPAFIQEKKEEEWTDEEKRAAAEYQKKVKELEEEREKFRKQLELELKKLQSVVQDGTQGFDEVHNQLFLKKVKVELVIAQLELKMQRLRYSLLQEEEMANHEQELGSLLEEKKRATQTLSLDLVQSKKQLDEFRNEYENLVADDRAIDKGFRREFTDLSVQQSDQLYKHFRKRPRGQKAKMMESQAYDSNSSNPFSDRPSTARQNDSAQRALDAALQELDRSMPDNVDASVWERLCRYRREKIECELALKQKALILAEMQAFVQRRLEEDEHLKTEIEELEEELNKLRTEKHNFITDLEIQLLLKQGQVEVDAGSFIPDYRMSLLIHRRVIEDLNKQIRQLSDSKIASMIESKDFRKGIVQLEWEHKKMTMEMEDLQNKMRDIVNMKVTREIQLYLTDPAEYDAKKAQEIAALEQTILAQKAQHEKLVKEKKRTVKQMKKSIMQIMEKNDALMRDLERLNVNVNERRQIHEISGGDAMAGDRMLAYKEIVKRRRLVELAKAQSQEVAVLRAEVERLRMRTFAALVQVEH